MANELQLEWDGTTWIPTGTVGHAPDYPLDITPGGKTYIDTTFDGAVRKHTRYRSVNVAMTWTWVTSTVRDLVEAVGSTAGTILLSCPSGTWEMYSEPTRAKETEWQVYDIGLKLKGTAL